MPAVTLSVAANLSVLIAAVRAANLTGVLGNESTAWTVLAPTDAAFAEALDAIQYTANELLNDTVSLACDLCSEIQPFPNPDCGSLLAVANQRRTSKHGLLRCTENMALRNTDTGEKNSSLPYVPRALTAAVSLIACPLPASRTWYMSQLFAACFNGRGALPACVCTH